jgi:hypothetical protein
MVLSALTIALAPMAVAFIKEELATSAWQPRNELLNPL